jgi:[acyl-carrier-protein] S-malonyltransferase
MIKMDKKDIAFVFPGQGAQYVGMAKDFYDIPEYRDYFDIANEKLGYDLKTIMFEGPDDELKQTYNTQPAILLHSFLALTHFRKNCGITPTFVAGHSLGEFTALVASDSLQLEDAILLVYKRGQFMVKASQGIPFKMAAILGLEKDKIIEICNNTDGIVVAANFNTPSQTVISGEADAVSKAIQECKKAGAKRAVELVVGGAFHSPFIKKSAEWMRAELEKIQFKPPKVPVVSNLMALPETDPETIRENLEKQIVSPVRWVESVEYMLNHRVDTFIEFGPGKVISGMIRAIDRNARRYNIDRIEDVRKVIDELLSE